tara:strand:+ start:1656 stop:2006 length:351 start_codon:yes stop_codon:yes gene_type:complete
VVEAAKGRALRKDLYSTGDDTTNRALQDVQQQVDAKFRSQQASPFATGRIITKVSMTAGTPERVAHKLGRDYIAWTVIRKSANADVWESNYTSPDSRSKFVVLDCSADVTVDLLVG